MIVKVYDIMTTYITKSLIYWHMQPHRWCNG